MNLEELGRQFGLDEAQTRAAFEQLAPVVAAGVRRNTQSPQGLEGLIRALQSGDHGRYVEEPSALEYDRVADDGNAILGHVFGSKDVSRGVANQAADLSGVSSAVLKKMLPVIAAIVMGQLAKKFTGGAQAAPQQAGGGLGDILGEILAGGGAAQQQSRGGGGGLGDILGDILGGGAGGPQPQSRGQGGGLGDILGDILGGGAGGGGAAPQAPRPQPGSGGGFSLDDLLREMTGGGGAGPQQQEEVVQRSRKSIDDMLGGGSQTGNAADDLLNSVERHIRRR